MAGLKMQALTRGGGGEEQEEEEEAGGGSSLHRSDGCYQYLGIYAGKGEEEEPRIVRVLSSLLEREVQRDEASDMKSKKKPCACSSSSSCCVQHQHQHQHLIKAFSGLRAPSIGIHSYLARIFKYAKCSPSCFVLAYFYLDHRLQLLGAASSPSRPPITPFNVHRLLITSIMVAAKFLDDSHFNNAYYAKVGGVSTLEMNKLEGEFLRCIGYRVHITLATFQNICNHFSKEATTQDLRPLFVLPKQSTLNHCTGHHCRALEEDTRKATIHIVECDF